MPLDTNITWALQLGLEVSRVFATLDQADLAEKRLAVLGTTFK